MSVTTETWKRAVLDNVAGKPGLELINVDGEVKVRSLQSGGGVKPFLLVDLKKAIEAL